MTDSERSVQLFIVKLVIFHCNPWLGIMRKMYIRVVRSSSEVNMACLDKLCAFTRVSKLCLAQPLPPPLQRTTLSKQG